MYNYPDFYNYRQEKHLQKYTIIWALIVIALAFGIFILHSCSNKDVVWAEEIDDTLAIRAIIGEAANQGYHGLLAVAVGIRNRGTLQGVYGLKAKHVDREPKWVWDMAKKAWQESEYNRIHSGTHWENIKAFGKPYWIKSMILVYQYKDHNFYKLAKKG